MMASGTKPKVYKDGQYSDPVYKKISRMNGEINRLTKQELQDKLKEFKLDTRGVKEVLRKRLKNYYKLRKLTKVKTGSTLYDYLAVIDFEATCDEGNTSYRHEIIEFPVVLIDVATCEVVDSMQEYVRPVVNPKLSNFCVKLTGITQDKVDNADEFPEVLKRVEAWMASHKLGQEKSFAVLTDGPWDMFRFMYYQCKESSIPMPTWSKKWVNVRKSYCNYYGCGRGGIEIMLNNLGMCFEGTPHSGIDDSLNIARIAITLLKDGCALNINERIQLQHNICEPNPEVRYVPVKQGNEENSNSGSEDSDDVVEDKSVAKPIAKPKKRRNRRGLVDAIEDLTINDGNKNELDDDGLADFVSFYRKHKS